MQCAKGRTPCENTVSVCVLFLNQIKWNENKMLLCAYLNSVVTKVLTFVLVKHKQVNC